MEVGNRVKVNRPGWERHGQIGRLVELAKGLLDAGEWIVVFSDGKEFSIHYTDLEELNKRS